MNTRKGGSFSVCRILAKVARTCHGLHARSKVSQTSYLSDSQSFYGDEI